MNTSVTTSIMITNMNTTAITVSARSSTPSTSPARLITSRASPFPIPDLLAAGGEQAFELLQRGGRLLAAAVETAGPFLADALELVLHLGARRLRQRIEADALVLHV